MRTNIQKIEENWKTITESSNGLFRSRAFEHAVEGYKVALMLAESLNADMTACGDAMIPFVQIYIISCNNIANTYLGLGKKTAAENMFKRSIYFLLHLCHRREVSLRTIENELKRAMAEYDSFLKCNADCKGETKILLREIKEQLAVKRQLTNNE